MSDQFINKNDADARKYLQVSLTGDNFQEEVLKNNGPVVVEIWADWCGASHIIKPIIRRVALKYNGQVKFGKLDIDVYPGTAGEYGVTTVPALLVFHKGQFIDRINGTFSNNDLETIINLVLKM